MSPSRLLVLCALTAACRNDPCGNGEIDAGEACDDGSANSDAAPCTSTCQVNECGDGLILAGVELCDDGPANADDASCTATCAFARCGDGLLLAGSEECDLGPDNSDDGECTARCKDAVCGDGIVQIGVEDCDDGADNGDDAPCTASCEIATCGDGLVLAGVETCDDGLANADDAGCTADCQVAVCGDDLIWAGVEECDDGNALDGDFCTSHCQFPATILLATADAKVIGEVGGDSAGYDIDALGDVNADGFDDFVVTASVQDGGGTDAGAAYVVRGPLVGPVDLSTASAKWVGEGTGNFLSFARGAGDVDGDGTPDLLLGASNGAGGALAGAAYLVSGARTGTVNVSQSIAKFVGESTQDFAGSALANAGDVDGDGVADFLIGASGRDDGGAASGAAYLVFGDADGTVNLSAAAAKLVGENASDLAGTAVAGAGDVDGDGVADLLVGAPAHATAGVPTGAAYLVLGTARGFTDLADADAKLVGEAVGDSAGNAVAGGADLDGDGLPDLVVGSPLDNEGGTDAGAAYVALGTTRGTGQLVDAHAKLIGGETGGRAGASVDVAGDVDGDGAEDLVVGANLVDEGSTNVGAAYVFFGPLAAGGVDLALAPITLLGESVDDLAGWRVSGAGDVDGDGQSDVIVSALQDDDGGLDAGAVYLMLGSSLSP